MTRSRPDAVESGLSIEDSIRRAQSAYRTGRSGEALELWSGLLDRDDIEPERELEIRFWHGTTLHGVGRYEEACTRLEPICFDPHALGTSPHWVYRIATRTALVQIELARPLDQIEALLERIADLAANANDPRRSRFWMARGRLEMARGRRAAAIKALERGLDGTARARHPFASTPYFRAILPLLLESGRLEDAREAFGRWEQSGDPETFMQPHVSAFRADWLRARGETGQALRHAMLAAEWSRRLNDIAGTLNATRALARAALFCGEIPRARGSLRDLLRERHRATPEDRYRIDLTSADLYLGLACLHAGLPVRDPELGGEIEVEVPTHVEAEVEDEREGALEQSVPGGRTVEQALGDASRACERAARGAAAIDAIFATRWRTSAVRRRTRVLHDLRKRVKRVRLAMPQELEGLEMQSSEAIATRLPLRRTQPHPSPNVVPAKSSTTTVEVDDDGAKSWLITPAEDLATLAEALIDSERQIFVPYPADHDGPFEFDLWIRGELAGSGRASITRPDEHTEQRLVIETDDAPPPRWLDRFARQARRHEGKRHFHRGEDALEAGENDRAVREFAETVALQPAWSTAWERNASSLLAEGRPEDALEASLRALEIDSSGPRAWATLARVFETQGRVREAAASAGQADCRAQQEEGGDGPDEASSESNSVPF